MLATVPPVWVNVAVVPKPVVAEVDTSKPVGAVTVIFAVKLVPDVLKVVFDDAVPVMVVNAANVPVALIVGDTAALVAWLPAVELSPVPFAVLTARTR